MRVIETELPGVLVLEPVVHRDPRGFFLETYHSARLKGIGVEMACVQANHSRSARNTLRGLHWQWRRPQSKLVRVVQGEIFDVAVDIRRGSPTFGRWVGVCLSGDNFRQMFIPRGFAHGFCVTSETSDVEYVCDAEYDPGGEAGCRWDDGLVGIAWPIAEPVLSERDRRHPPLDLSRPDLPSFPQVL